MSDDAMSYAAPDGPDLDLVELTGAYENPAVQIVAEYPATDGYCPERIEVQIRDAFGDGAFVTEIIAALARVPRVARTRS